MSETRIGVIGGGNMAHAIIEGGVASGRFAFADWVVAEPDAARRDTWERRGVGVVERAGGLGGALGPDDPLLLAVKPQMLEAAASDLGGAGAGRLVITILAGTPSATVARVIGGGCRVVRAMPNTPARIGRGTTALARGVGATEADVALGERVFGAVGGVVRIDESMFDAFTAVAGSGPAYLFYLAEALARAAADVGFGAEEAETIVRSVLVGSALLLEGSRESAGELRRAVTSKGGTTEAALGVLEEAGVGERFVRAVRAARDRGIALGSDGAGAGGGAGGLGSGGGA